MVRSILSIVVASTATLFLFQNCGDGQFKAADGKIAMASETLCTGSDCVNIESTYRYDYNSEDPEVPTLEEQIVTPVEVPQVPVAQTPRPAASPSSQSHQPTRAAEPAKTASGNFGAVHVVAIWKSSSGRLSMASATMAGGAIGPAEAEEYCKKRIQYSGKDSSFDGKAASYICVQDDFVILHRSGVAGNMFKMCGKSCGSHLKPQVVEALKKRESSSIGKLL